MKGQVLASRLIGVTAEFPFVDSRVIARRSGGTSRGECLGLDGVWVVRQGSKHNYRSQSRS
jgi:hypothetical protein